MLTAFGGSSDATGLRVVILGAALMVGAALACTGGSAMGADAVLQDVPYLGDDWQTYLDGPQDFSLPSALRAVMFYLGVPQERDYRFYLAVGGEGLQQLWQPETMRAAFDDPWAIDADPGRAVRRMFAAAGYRYEVLGIPELCAQIGMPLAALTSEVDADGLRAAICASIDAGKPVILLGTMPCAVVAGYQADGQVLVGWRYVFDGGEPERDEHGYLRIVEWPDLVCGAITVGEQTGPPPMRETWRDALVWAVRAGRTPRVGEWVGGLEALNAWAAALTPEPDLDPADVEVFEKLFEAHDCTAMTLAEGRAYANDVLKRIAELEPDAADELLAAARCYGLIHDLMWRIWQTPEGSWPGNANRERFADPEVRRELRRIVLTVRDLDTQAINHVARALPAMGVDLGDIAPPLEWEAEVVARLDEEEAASGADPAARGAVHAGLTAEGVPTLAFGQGKDCTFIGALEAALAPTAHPYSYEQLMGWSGLAFRTRWFSNPEHEKTEWGDARWHPISPHGDGPAEIAALARATGWRLRAEDVPEAARALGRERNATDAVLSLARALPAVVGLNTDMACVWGYRIHSVSLMVRDYQRPREDEVLVTGYDEALHSPFVFLDGYGEPLPERDALIEALRIAVAGGDRAPDGPMQFGLGALDTWCDDLGEYEACDAAERDLLQATNWWMLMHLLDTRTAAVAFLEASADLVGEQAGAALAGAVAAYRAEVGLLGRFLQINRDLVPWWGGAGARGWDATTRATQADILAQARDLEAQALAALREALAAEGQTAAATERVLEDVPALRWEDGGHCFSGAAAKYLQFLGEDAPYDVVMGISGAAWRLVWDPGKWSPDNLIMLWYGRGVGESRVFGAFGYEYSFLDGHAGTAGEAALREAIVSEIDGGRPVLAIGIEGPEECLIAGYREGGAVLVGQSYFQQDKERYFAARDWFGGCMGLHMIGGKGAVPDPHGVLLGSLRWAVTMARTPEMSGRATGLAAYEAWAEDMLRDRDFPADDLDEVVDNNMSIGDNFLILFDARRAGACYLERSAAQVGEEAAGHLRAAAELMDRESSTVWGRRDICPYLHPWDLEQIVDHDVRVELSTLVLECRGLYAQAIEHIEQALAAEAE